MYLSVTFKGFFNSILTITDNFLFIFDRTEINVFIIFFRGINNINVCSAGQIYCGIKLYDLILHMYKFYIAMLLYYFYCHNQCWNYLKSLKHSKTWVALNTQNSSNKEYISHLESHIYENGYKSNFKHFLDLLLNKLEINIYENQKKIIICF